MASKRPSAKKPNGSSNGDGISDQEVARRAYEIYETQGRGDGSDLDHWLEAERQLKQPLPGVKPKRAKKTPAAGV